MNTLTNNEFYEAMRGSFTSMLRWPNLDALWQTVENKAAADWYIYAVGEPPPDTVSTAEQVRTFIREIDKLLHKEHKEDYCGIVYADDKQEPTFIKIYDPNNLGVVCGYSDNPPAPGWIMSLIKPEPLENSPFLPGNRKRWWQRLFSKSS